jgi:hypothetical protein
LSSVSDIGQASLVSASCGQMDPVFRPQRCASQEKEHRS